MNKDIIELLEYILDYANKEITNIPYPNGKYYNVTVDLEWCKKAHCVIERLKKCQ